MSQDWAQKVKSPRRGPPSPMPEKKTCKNSASMQGWPGMVRHLNAAEWSHACAQAPRDAEAAQPRLGSARSAQLSRHYAHMNSKRCTITLQQAPLQQLVVSMGMPTAPQQPASARADSFSYAFVLRSSPPLPASHEFVGVHECGMRLCVQRSSLITLALDLCISALACVRGLYCCVS